MENWRADASCRRKLAGDVTPGRIFFIIFRVFIEFSIRSTPVKMYKNRARTARRPADTRRRWSRKNLFISGHLYAVRTVKATPTPHWNTGSYRVRMDTWIVLYILVQHNIEGKKKKPRFCTVPRSPREYIESFNKISGRLTSITLQTSFDILRPGIAWYTEYWQPLYTYVHNRPLRFYFNSNTVDTVRPTNNCTVWRTVKN